MTQCSFIGSVAFALRCARRSRFTTLSRIFPPSLSAVVPSLLFTRFPFSSIVLFIFTLVSSFPSTLVSSFHPRSCPCSDGPFAWKIGYSLLIQRNIAYHCSYYFCVLWKILLELERIQDFCFLNYLRSILNFLIFIQNISIFLDKNFVNVIWT